MSAFSINDSPFTYSSSGAPSGNDPLEYSGSITFPASLLEFSGHIGDFLSNDGTNLVWSSDPVVWGTESSKQPLVIGATGGDIDSQSNLYYDTTDKYLHIEDSSGTPGIIFSNDDGTTDHASIELDSSTNGLNISALDDTDITISSKRVLTGNYTSTAFWSVRDPNTPVYSYSFAVYKPDTTDIIFGVYPTGFITMPELPDDDAELHVVAIDDGTGFLTKRSVASIVAEASLDHDELGGLSDDDHSQYALLDGRSGDTLKIDDLTEYTADAGVTIEGTILKDSKVGIGIGAPTYALEVLGSAELSGTLYVDTITESTTDAGVTIEGLTIEDNDIRFTSATTITDGSGTPAGLQYDADYSGNYTARSLVDKGYVDGAMASGITWLTGVTDIINFTTNEPAAPDDGDRYINTATGNSSVTAQAMVANRIYEWDSGGSTWDETTPSDGDTLNVEENSITPTNDVGWHTFDGSNWIFIGSVIAHNDTTSKQGGSAGQYYHLTSGQHTIATQSASAVQSGYLTSADWSTFNTKDYYGGWNLKVDGVDKGTVGASSGTDYVDFVGGSNITITPTTGADAGQDILTFAIDDVPAIDGTPVQNQLAFWSTLGGDSIGGDADLTWDGSTLQVTGTIAGTTVTGANVTTGSNPGHTHTTAAISNLSSYTGFDARYYTETELNTDGGGGQVHWNNITAVPASVSGAMGSFIIDTDNEASTTITDAETITFSEGTGMSVSRSSNTITFAVDGVPTISGTPANNYLAVWDSPTSVEGVSALNWDGSTLQVTGTLAATTVTGANVTSGSNPGHTHTGYASVAGTPANNRLAVWTSANEIEGESNLTYSSGVFNVVGTMTVDSKEVYDEGDVAWITTDNDANPSWDFDTSHNFTWAPTSQATGTLSISHMVDGDSGVLIIKSDTNGTLTLPANSDPSSISYTSSAVIIATVLRWDDGVTTRYLWSTRSTAVSPV